MPIAPVHTTEEQARQYRKDQRRQAHTKRVQGTLGLAAAAAGATGAGFVTAGKLKKLPHLVERGYTVGTGSAGLGALAGFNAARGQFREANVASKQSRMKMDNTRTVKKSLVEVAKGVSVAVSPDSLAWRMAGTRDDERWRNYVSPGAKLAYDVPLAPSRKKRDRLYTTGNVLVGGGGLGIGAAALARKAPKKYRLAGGGAGLAAIAGGVGAHKKSNRYDVASRKIRARGMQRMVDTKVEKGLLRVPKVPGSFNRGAVVRLQNGRQFLRRPSPTGVRLP